MSGEKDRIEALLDPLTPLSRSVEVVPVEEDEDDAEGGL